MIQDQTTSRPDYGSIIVRGARENNLKDISLDIPKRQITVFTGVSGSGKSSLVFGTIAAESQRLISGKNIAEFSSMQVNDLAVFVRAIEAPQVGPMLASLAARLENLVTIGLGYLSLDRESSSLSGGESQTVKMVRHLGSSLTDITYVFDEPSVGLHPHDVGRLAGLMSQLRDKGNTVLIVEHKPDMIAIADHVVDIGPLAGSKGGEIVYEGDVTGLLTSGTHGKPHEKASAVQKQGA
jgi:excinuclease UvrABC ATPase subunit